MAKIKIKRVYDTPSKEDGVRILIDRLWPRGLKKQDLAMDAWIKELAPSPPLRTWFGHDPSKFQEFKKKYYQELDDSKSIWEPLIKPYFHHTITFLYAAKDPEINHAQCLKAYLVSHLSRSK